MRLDRKKTTDILFSKKLQISKGKVFPFHEQREEKNNNPRNRSSRG